MSFGLYWEPSAPTRGNPLPTELKFIMARRFWGGDGSTRGETLLISGNDMAYLQGVRDATASCEIQEGVDELISAINDHGEVRVWVGEQDG